MYAEKLPPHDADAEEAVIGSLLIDGEVINRIAPLVGVEDFYRERNRWCYQACQSLYQRGEPIDQISVARELSLRERLEAVTGERIAALEAVEPEQAKGREAGLEAGRGAVPERDASESGQPGRTPEAEMEQSRAPKGVDRDLGL